MDDKLVKLDILGHDDPTALRMLHDITGLDPRTIPLDDPETMRIFSSSEPLGISLDDIDCEVGSIGIPEFGTAFVRQMLMDTRPTTMEELVRISGDMKVTMHRAFDVCKDPYETLEQCVSLGIDTILTSGQKDSAWNGREMLKELEERAKGRIEILAGAGINPGVISKLSEYAGLKTFHMSGKIVKESRMEFRRQGVPMGMPGMSEFEIWQTDEEAVREAVKVLKNISGLDKRDEIV